MPTPGSLKEWRKFVVRCLGLSLLIHLVTAIYSLGFQHADEHFQILEFVAAKLGMAPLGNMSMEFPNRMRPYFQPWLYWCMTQVWLAVGVRNPFTWATSYRIFSSLIGWLSTAGLAACVPLWFVQLKDRRFAILCLSLIWVLPSFHARVSSENLGGAFLILGVVLMTLKGPGISGISAWLAGLLMGFSFECRFQMAIAILGAVAWFATLGKIRFRALVFLVIGGASAFALGRVLDHWGYGAWTFSPWNYFKFNLVQDHVSDFGKAPWWDYFRIIWTETWPPLGFVVLISSLFAWLRRPMHVLTWTFVPFFAAHCLIGHKEGRFLFPVIHATPIFLALAVQGFRLPQMRWLRISMATLLSALYFDNIVALLVLCFVPAARIVPLEQAIYDRVPTAPGSKMILYTVDLDPFNHLGSQLYFYQPGPEHYELRTARDLSEFETKLQSSSQPLWLFYEKLDLPPGFGNLESRCVRRFTTIPVWVFRVFGGVPDTVRTWSLWECQQPGN